MAFFTPNYSKPGPGVDPDAPRKKGLARFWELCSRDFFSLWAAGLLALLGGLPLILALTAAVQARALLPALLAGVAGGALAGPQLCGLADTVLRCLRDEPGYWWSRYRTAWRRSLRASLLPGALLGLLLAAEVFSAALCLTGTAAGWQLGVLLAGCWLLAGFSLYLWAQVALFDLPLPGLAKNALFLFMSALPRSLGACTFVLAYGLAALLLFPLSALVLPLTSLWLPAAAGGLMIYAPMEKTLGLEAAVRAVQEQARERDEE